MDELKLQSGEDYSYFSLKFKHPTIREIAKLPNGFTEYSEMASVFTSSFKDIADILWFEGKIWYEDISSEWDFFVETQIVNAQKKEVNLKLDGLEGKTECLMVEDNTKKALNYFLYLDNEYILISKSLKDEEEPQVFLCCCNEKEGEYFCDENSLKFTEVHYNALQDFLKKINWIGDEKQDFEKGGNRKAKEYFLKQKYRKRGFKSRNKQTVTFNSIFSALIAKGIRYQDIWDYPIYMFYDIYYRTEHILNYDSTVLAYSSGTIDTKKNPINWEAINWSAVLKKK